MKILVCFLISVVFIFPLFAQEENGAIDIQIKGFRNDVGLARILLFTKSEGFPDQVGKAYREVSLTIKDQTANLRLESLPFQTYAVSVLHDENANLKLDTNFFGFPLEGYGCSNNPQMKWRKPKFQDAAFIFKEKHERLVIEIAYL